MKVTARVQGRVYWFGSECRKYWPAAANCRMPLSKNFDNEGLSRSICAEAVSLGPGLLLVALL
jgi:hypothetical protein